MGNFLRRLLLVLAVPSFAAGAASAAASHAMPMSMSTPLTAPGNGAFGAIQEVVRDLQADPNTDWSKVNLEALREHLVDMRNMTLDVTVRSQEPIPGGVEIQVSGNGPAAEASLARVFADHPAQLAMETGWKMTVAKHGSVFDLVVTTSRPDQVAEVRGLGYIGLLAIGNHHQLHHWEMATGMRRAPAVPAHRPER